MRVLLDESVPVQVRGALLGHDVQSVSDLGWKGLENGELLTSAEQVGFEVLVIADKNLRHQQNRPAAGSRWSSYGRITGRPSNDTLP